MSLDGLQHKLTKAQQVKMQKNICLLHLYTNQVFFIIYSFYGFKFRVLLSLVFFSLSKRYIHFLKYR